MSEILLVDNNEKLIHRWKNWKETHMLTLGDDAQNQPVIFPSVLFQPPCCTEQKNPDGQPDGKGLSNQSLPIGLCVSRPYITTIFNFNANSGKSQIIIPARRSPRTPNALWSAEEPRWPHKKCNWKKDKMNNDSFPTQVEE